MPLPKGPYDDVPEDQRSKIQAMVSTADKLLLQSIYPERGIMLFLVEQFTHAIITDIKTHGITHYSPENSTRVLAFIRQRTRPELTHDRPLQADAGATSGVCLPLADPSVLTADFHEGPAGRVKRSGGKSRNKKDQSKSNSRS